ncbi:hypothetical protein ACRE_075550 [Hapsidospora chrysogenum ATCC 11550]|uniref:Uncharacterized protein n=1 Tax=Hapsidospora chrysogenum (strain ATCC 11550 / CBS 779.69 / DSM 880 / IAM 14645 / JCM 23072 / IMI 49137) TaxID=857340 RepID=A0A086SX81_HAPC1|nr:hypothetical protein ACRE_075550 [Hapsidospora chrysogenum ATCC 11550]
MNRVPARFLATAASPSLRHHLAAYKRLRIRTEKEIENSYPLICNYLENPKLADPVEELVIYNEYWSRYAVYDGLIKNLSPKQDALPVRQEAHAAFATHIAGLGLSKPITARMLDVLEWKKKHLGLRPDIPGGYTAANVEYAEIAVIMLLSLCKNITRFQCGSIGGSINRTAFLHEYLLANNYDAIPSPALQSLEVLTVYPGGALDEREYDSTAFLETMRRFHRLPRLSAIVMDGVCDYQDNDRVVLPAGAGTFSKLEFHHGDIPSPLMGTMIRVSKGLEEFSLKPGGLWTHDSADETVGLKTVGKCLLEQRTTLRKLDIDVAQGMIQSSGEEEEPVEDYVGNGPDEATRILEGQMDRWCRIDERDGRPGPLWPADLPDTRKYGYGLGSLHDFEALTHLRISLEALLGIVPPWLHVPKGTKRPELPFRLVDGLPPSLERLVLYGYKRGANPEMDEQVDELLAQKDKRFPKLKEVHGVEETIGGMVEGLLLKADKLAEENGGETEPEDTLWSRPDHRDDPGWVRA